MLRAHYSIACTGELAAYEPRSVSNKKIVGDVSYTGTSQNGSLLNFFGAASGSSQIDEFFGIDSITLY